MGKGLLEAAKNYKQGERFSIPWRGGSYDATEVGMALEGKKCKCGEEFFRWGVIGHPYQKEKGRGMEFRGVFVCDSCHDKIVKILKLKAKP